MAKKTKSITVFSGGYNSYVSPKDLKDHTLAKSQGVVYDKPGILRLMGKASHVTGQGLTYRYLDSVGGALDASTDVLGKSRGTNRPLIDPGSGLFSFSSRWSYGQIGRIESVANDTGGTVSNRLKLEAAASTPIFGAENYTIEVNDGDYIYIWGINVNDADTATGSPVHELNNRYFKVDGDTITSGIGGYMYLVNVVDGSDTDVNITKFTRSSADYSRSNHGGYFKTIPKHSFTRYIAMQDGECFDLHYDEEGSANRFSKSWALPGTYGLLESDGTGAIGLRAQTDADLGIDSNFNNWPEKNGITYAVKPYFRFTNDALRILATARNVKASPADSRRNSSVRWLGYINRNNLFGRDGLSTYINEWYYTEANLRKPTTHGGGTNNFGALSTNANPAEVYYDYSWETGPLEHDASLTDNEIWPKSNIFTEANAVTNQRDMSGNVHFYQLYNAIGNEQINNAHQVITYFNTFFGSKTLPGFNLVYDGGMLYNKADAENTTAAADKKILHYWHTINSGNKGDCDTSGTNDWTWVPHATNKSYIQKSGSSVYSLAYYPKTSAPPTDYSWIVQFTLTDCAGPTGSGLDIRVSGGENLGGTSTRVIANDNDTAATDGRVNYYKARVLVASGDDFDLSDPLVTFTPSNSGWSGKISDVSVYAANSFNTLGIGFVKQTVGAYKEMISNDTFTGGWDNAEYEFYTTWLYDEGLGIQETTATKIGEVSFSHEEDDNDNAYVFKLWPVVCFSSNGDRYNMMDKRITGAKIYFKRKFSAGDSSDPTEIHEMLEMDWIKGSKQAGEKQEWIPWTSRDLSQETIADDIIYTTTLNDANGSAAHAIGYPNTTDGLAYPKFNQEWKDMNFTYPEPPDDTFSFSGITGYKWNEEGQGNVKYNARASVDGVEYVGGVVINEAEEPNEFNGYAMNKNYQEGPSRILRSASAMNDVFPLSEILTIPGLEIHSIIEMFGFKKYLVVLTEENSFILSIDGNLVEVFAELPNNGIRHKCQALKTEFGVVWANNMGCFVFDGEKVINLIDGMISRDDQGWVNNLSLIHI